MKPSWNIYLLTFRPVSFLKSCNVDYLKKVRYPNKVKLMSIDLGENQDLLFSFTS